MIDITFQFFQIFEQISVLAAALSLADVSCSSPTSLVAVYKCVISFVLSITFPFALLS